MHYRAGKMVRVPVSGTIDRLQMALEAEGVTFIGADASGGPGVRLRA